MRSGASGAFKPPGQTLTSEVAIRLARTCVSLETGTVSGGNAAADQVAVHFGILSGHGPLNLCVQVDVSVFFLPVFGSVPSSDMSE